MPYTEAVQFDLLFIDGDHSFHQVMRDIKNYSALVKPGGLICIHDYHPYFHTGSAWTSIEIQTALQTLTSHRPVFNSIDSMLILQATLDINKSDIFTLAIPPKQPKILLIGDNSNPVADYYQILTKMGYYVYWLGDQAAHFNTINFKRNVEVNERSMAYAGEAVVYTKRFPLRHILDQIGSDFDLILQFQGWYYPSDMEKSPIPYIYYCSEGWWAEIPKVAWKVIVPNYFTQTMVLSQNPQIKQQDISIIPFSLGGVFNTRIISPLQKRDKKISYAGSLYRFTLLYQDRREILYQLLQDPELNKDCFFHWDDGKPWNYEGSHFKAGKGHLNAEEYTQLLDESQFGVNIPTRMGANFRDLEVPACGAILVTKKTEDLVEMGFKHGINCYFYSNYKELKEILQKPYDPMVAMMGYTLVNMKHRHIHRIPQFEGIFSQYLEPLGLKTKMYEYGGFTDEMGHHSNYNGQEEIIWNLKGPLP